MTNTALNPGLVPGELPWPPDQSIRYLSLWQPWASAIPAGLKHCETRGRLTHFRGWLMIHAAQHRLTKRELADLPFVVRSWYLDRLDRLPFGAVVAVVRVADCFPTYLVRPAGSNVLHGAPYRIDRPALGPGELLVRPAELLWGGYGPDRCAWPLANIVKLPTPVPMKAQQGIKVPPLEVLEAVLDQIKNGAKHG